MQFQQAKVDFWSIAFYRCNWSYITMIWIILLLSLSQSLFGASFEEHIKYSPDKENRIGHILIDDRSSGINQSTWVYVKNALDYYKQNPPIFIILELNTPGGEVFSAQTISDALKEMDTQLDIPIVAFVNNWAISAGAMLAYSSRYITTVKDGSMGAAEPILQGEGGKQETASEKVNSAIRTDFANRAAFFDRNPYLAEAMVDKDIILVKRDGKVIKIDNDTLLLPTDFLISPKGKLLTLTAKEMLEYHVADLLVPPAKVLPLTEDEKSSGKYPASKFLLFSAPFFKDIPHAEIDSFRLDWKGTLVSWLAHPVVQSLLFLGLMIGFYMEISTPGFGLPGSIGAICLVLIIMSSYGQEIAGYLEVVLLLAGLSIILFDLFILPTFGLLGVVGLLFAIAGLLGLMLPGIQNFNYEYTTNTVNAAGEMLFNRLSWLSGTFLVGLAIIVALARWVLPRFKGFDRFVSTGDQTGWSSSGDTSGLPQAGSKGTAFSPLRPSGKVLVGGKIYEALTNGSFVAEGKPIEITGSEGSTLYVKEDIL